MKKLLMAVMLFCGVISGFAQTKGEFHIGPTVGMNVSNITDTESDCRIGFNLGARLDYGITNNVYFASGLMFSQKGCQNDYLDGDIKIEETENPLYLTIPIHIGFSHKLNNSVSIFGETGPYLAFGVAGKIKLEALGEEEKMDFFGDDAGNIFDFGWGLRAGVEVNRFQIHLGYEYGFTKVIDDTSFHNSNFAVGISYMF